MSGRIRWKIIATLGAATLLVGAGALWLVGRGPRDLRELRAIRAQGIDLLEVVAAGSNPTAHAGKLEEWARQCVELNERHPNTAGGLGALWLAACWAPGTASGVRASRTLVESARTADLGQIVTGEERAYVRQEIAGPADLPAGIAAIPPAILERLRKQPDQTGGAEAATLVCVMTAKKRTAGAVPEFFDEAAQLITQHYVESPAIVNFCECVGFLGGSPPWAARYEPTVREILRKNRHRNIRCAASFAAIMILRKQDQVSQNQKRQVEAESLCEQFLKDFDGKTTADETGAWYGYRQIEEMDCRRVANELDEMRHRALGMPAPEIAGVDLHNRPMKLSDFRGRVVLLSFWATSCGPCMRMIPDERDLADRLRNKPFAIVGVNCDDDPQVAIKAEKTQQISWRSFRERGGKGRSISEQWKNEGLPTVYVIDDKGLIRNHWVGVPPEDSLTETIDRLVAAVR